MKFFSASLCLCGYIAFSAILHADFHPSLWHFRSPLTVPASHLCELRLPPQILASARPDLSDLRILRGAEETPFVLDRLEATTDTREAQPELLDKSLVPATGTQITLDLGRPTRHNRLRIETREVNFRYKVRIETAEEPGRWAIVRTDGYIFNVTQASDRASQLIVDYPLSTRRYVRATFLGWEKPEALTAAHLAYEEKRPEVLQEIATLDPRRTEDVPAQATILDLDLGAALPHSRVTIETAAPSFRRTVEVQSSPDGQTWTYVTRADILRAPHGQETLALVYPERHGRFLRLRILNHDDKPLPIGRVRVETIARRIRFLAPAGGEFWLYYGNDHAKAPTYDLAALLSRQDADPGSQIAPGPEQLNPDYRPPVKPWTDRYPAVLTATVVLSVLGLGFISIRFLLKVKNA